MTTYRVDLICPRNTVTAVAWNVREDQRAKALTSARKAMFLRNGSVNYADLTAAWEGWSLEVVKEVTP